jgi:hypothetical protein
LIDGRITIDKGFWVVSLINRQYLNSLNVIPSFEGYKWIQNWIYQNFVV